MTLVTPVNAWSAAITTTVDTIFQVHKGTAYLAILVIGAAAPADLMDGYILRSDFERSDRDSIIVPAGLDVRYRTGIAVTQDPGRGIQTRIYYAPFG